MKNFLIVGTQRTGSTALAEIRGLNHWVSCAGEIILEVPCWRKLKAAERALVGDFSYLTTRSLEHIAKKYDKKKPWFGFRWLFHASGKWIIHPRFAPALWLDRLEDCLCWLTRRSDIHIIHIVRRQGLDWLKSVYVAYKSNAYKGIPYPDGIKVSIPEKEAVSRLRTKNWIDSRLASLQNTNPYTCIEYENFLADQDTTIAAALKFIRCDPSKMYVADQPMKRQSKGEATDYIINSAELVKVLDSLDLLVTRFDQH